MSFTVFVLSRQGSFLDQYEISSPGFGTRQYCNELISLYVDSCSEEARLIVDEEKLFALKEFIGLGGKR